jgi:hypothetical protein
MEINLWCSVVHIIIIVGDNLHIIIIIFFFFFLFYGCCNPWWTLTNFWDRSPLVPILGLSSPVSNFHCLQISFKLIQKHDSMSGLSKHVRRQHKYIETTAPMIPQKYVIVTLLRNVSAFNCAGVVVKCLVFWGESCFWELQNLKTEAAEFTKKKKLVPI